MIKTIFNAIIYQPIYNILILLVALIPGGDVGIAVILVTCIIKAILLPFSKKATESQLKLKSVQAEIDALKVKFANDKQEQARKVMALYKEKGINPFSGFGILLIQLPVIMALYWIIFKGGLPIVNTDLLYSFIPVPTTVSMHFLGVFDISVRSIFVAILVAVSQFLQIRLTMPPTPAKSDNPSFKDDLARSMSMQMKYVMPVIVGFVTYSLPAVVGLYWITSNVFSIVQEMYLRKDIYKNKIQ